MHALMTDIAQQLEDWLRETPIHTLQLRGPGTFIHLTQATGHHTDPMAEAGAVARPENATSTIVRAGSVGVVMHAHPLRDDPLVQIGQRVLAGQTVALLRVGAVLLPVPAPHDGVVRQVLADNGHIVGYGDRLVEIEKEGTHAN